MATFGGGAALVFVLFAGAYLPAFRAGQPSDVVVEDVARELSFRPEATVVACADTARIQRDVLFFVRRTVSERCDLWNVAASRIPHLILATPEETAALSVVPTVREVRSYRALPATALTLKGILEGPTPQSFVLLANFTTTDPVAEAKRKKDRRQALKEPGARP